MRGERVFPALLKYWRGRRGISQLALSMLTDVSARHISYLESGRSKPTEGMVLRLTRAMGASLREQNEALSAAGFPPRFEEPPLSAISPAVDAALNRMLKQQEPFPLALLSADYRIIQSNAAAGRVFSRFVVEPERLRGSVDMVSLLFDARLARPFIRDWPRIASSVVARLHREAMERPADALLAQRLRNALAFPEVRKEWRQPDFSRPLESTLNIWLERGKVAVGFLTTLTSFSAPGVISLEELRIESYFPLDEATRRACEKWAREK